MLAVARRVDVGLLALDAGLAAGVAGLVATALGLAGVAFAAIGFAGGTGFLALGFLTGGAESAFTAGLAACFTGEDAFGW